MYVCIYIYMYIKYYYNSHKELPCKELPLHIVTHSLCVGCGCAILHEFIKHGFNNIFKAKC